MSKRTLGVIVGRFQVPELHDAHRALIERVHTLHTRVLVGIGQTLANANSRDPMSYEVRKLMVKHKYPRVVVCEVRDVGEKRLWSQKLDALIREKFPGYAVVMYGSRDSFLDQYVGVHETCMLPTRGGPSGTKIRVLVGKKILSSVDFRKGIIFDQMRRRKIPYQTIDLAILSDDGDILLGSKQKDAGKLRFIGGFVDVADRSLEEAVIRESGEEVDGVTIDNPRYICSAKIDDRRYRGTGDGIMTAFFYATCKKAPIFPKDDLDGVTWVRPEKLLDVIVPEHRVLAERLMLSITKEHSLNIATADPTN